MHCLLPIANVQNITSVPSVNPRWVATDLQDGHGGVPRPGGVVGALARARHRQLRLQVSRVAVSRLGRQREVAAVVVGGRRRRQRHRQLGRGGGAEAVQQRGHGGGGRAYHGGGGGAGGWPGDYRNYVVISVRQAGAHVAAARVPRLKQGQSGSGWTLVWIMSAVFLVSVFSVLSYNTPPPLSW